jgi:hypothetical protein
MQQPPGYPPPPGPPGYGYPPPQQPYGAPPGGGQQFPYGSPPPMGGGGGGAPPPKQGMSTAAIVLIVLVAVIVVVGGTCVTCLCVTVKGGTEQDDADKRSARNVPIADLLNAYKANEVRADSTYKGKWIKLQGGQVDEVRSSYVMIGTGKLFEIPQVQCMLKPDQLGKASGLTKGRRVTVRGKVQMMLINVLVQDCEIL